MSQGKADPQQDLLDDVAWFCEDVLAPSSIYKVLNRQGHRLFPDEMFADLYERNGRRSVPPSIVAVVMVLQRLEGLSDREAVERYAFDTRWRYAAGVSGYGSDKWGTFVHTVLVGMRARLAKSDDPRRIFDVTLKVASEAGLGGWCSTLILLRPAIKSRLHGIRSPVTVNVSTDTPPVTGFASDRTDVTFLRPSRRRGFSTSHLSE